MVHCSRENVQGKPPRIRNTHPIVYLGCGDSTLVERDGTVILHIDDGVGTRRQQFSISKSQRLLLSRIQTKCFYTWRGFRGSEVDKEDQQGVSGDDQCKFGRSVLQGLSARVVRLQNPNLMLVRFEDSRCNSLAPTSKVANKEDRHFNTSHARYLQRMQISLDPATIGFGRTSSRRVRYLCDHTPFPPLQGVVRIEILYSLER